MYFDINFSGNSVEIKKVKTLLDKAPATSIEPPSKKAKADETADVISSSENDECKYWAAFQKS